MLQRIWKQNDREVLALLDTAFLEELVTFNAFLQKLLLLGNRKSRRLPH
jgi:hypothetical protein